MDALTLLLSRRSTSRLIAPAPENDALNTLLSAGMRAPDHGALRPWQFIVIRDEGRDKFSQLLEKAAIDDQLDQEACDKARNAPYRAPLIIAVIAKVVEHSKIPVWEQIVAASCAVHAMQMAAVAQGFGGIWRSGAWTENRIVKAGLGCEKSDKIVGFLYLGTPELKAPTKVNPADFSYHVTYL